MLFQEAKERKREIREAEESACYSVLNTGTPRFSILSILFVLPFLFKLLCLLLPRFSSFLVLFLVLFLFFSDDFMFAMFLSFNFSFYHFLQQNPSYLTFEKVLKVLWDHKRRLSRVKSFQRPAHKARLDTTNNIILNCQIF